MSSSKPAAPSLLERATEPGFEVMYARAERAATSTAMEFFSGYSGAGV